MLKLTFCTYDRPGSVGGPFSWLARLLPYLRDQGFEVRCLVLLHFGETGPTVEALRAAGIPCEVTLCPDRTVDRVRWILQRLRENPPDVFAPNLPVAAYFSSRWIRSSGIPTVGILHSDDPFYRGIQDEFVFGKQAFRLSSLVCVSKELERQVLERKPKETIVQRIPYGVPVPETMVKRVAERFRVAYFGRFAEEQKRISEVTEAFCRVAREIEGVEATLFGDGPDRANVERILGSDGRGLTVHDGGAVPADKVRDQMLSVDVVVLLSDYEGLPIALMEAMACGCVPVCLEMRSGIGELVQDGVTGLIVKDRGNSFVDAIRRLQDDPALWQKLSSNSRERIKAEFSDVLCDAKWVSLFKDFETGCGSRKIRIPRRIRLPKRHPDLETAENRQRGAIWPVRWYRKGRIYAGKVRRKWLRICT